jgi:multiple sugar transport system substrate-binding protein
MKQRYIVTIISVILSLIAILVLVIRLNETETPALAQERWLELNEEAQLIFTQYWRFELEEGVFDSLITEFEKRYPTISIRINDLSYSEMQNSVINETVFSESDLLAVNPRWLYEAVKHEQIEMLIDQQQELWSVPVISFMDLLFYRTDILQAAGFDRPPKTRNEFLRYARAVNKETSSIGLALSPENPLGLYTDIFSWIWACGGQMVQNGRLNMNNKDTIEVFKFFNTLYSEGLLLPETFSQTNEQKIDAFVDGSIAMMIAPVSTIALLRTRMADESFGVTTIPISDTYIGKPLFGLTNWHIAISRYSPHKEAARLFISFLLEQAALLAVSAHAVPGAPVNPQKHHVGTLAYDKAFDIYTSGNGIQEFDLFPRNHELEPLIRDELYSMFEEGQSPENTVLAIQNKWGLQ